MTTRDQIIKKYVPHFAAASVHGNMITFELPKNEIVAACEAFYHHHQIPLKMITALDERAELGMFRIIYVFGIPKEKVFLAPYILVNNEFPSLTPTFHEASIYERKIKTFFGLNPLGHPDPRPLILHENWPAGAFPLRKDFDWRTRPALAEGEFQFRKLGGEGIYEIPVGPVHAGIIEPGHFRFSVAGEEILLLEPRLGYSHKGSEKLFEVLPLADKVKLAERISGDSSFSHAMAFCLALESLGDLTIPERDDYLRVIFAELERLANHLGDIGAIMTDTGFNFGGAHCGRLREDVMQINERLTGSRFLRGAIRVGGVATEPGPEITQELTAALGSLKRDFQEVIAIAENSTSLINRLKNTGVLPFEVAEDHGVVGVGGKAVGFDSDARVDYPYAAYQKIGLKIAIAETGDVYARFRVRIKEILVSIEMLNKALQDLPEASHNEARSELLFKKNSFAVGIVEGWRGDIVYLVATNSSGEISRVDVRDPSFLNWTALGYAGQENMVPDFPLINKSFNLSYSGNDL